MNRLKINTISGIAAIATIAMMFVPMVYDIEFMFDRSIMGGIIFIFSRATSGFYESEPMWKIFALILIVDVVLLIIWALRSFRKPEQIRKLGIITAIVNLLSMGFLCLTTQSAHGTYIIVVILTLVLSVTLVVIAIIQRKQINMVKSESKNSENTNLK